MAPGASCGVLGGSWGLLEPSWGDLSRLLGSLGGLLGSLGGLVGLLASSWVSPYSPSGLVTTPALNAPPSQDDLKPLLTSLHFSSLFLLRLGSLLGLHFGAFLGAQVGSSSAQVAS